MNFWITHKMEVKIKKTFNERLLVTTINMVQKTYVQIFQASFAPRTLYEMVVFTILK